MVSCECVNNNNDCHCVDDDGEAFQISSSNRCICSTSFSSKRGGEHIFNVLGLSSVRLSVSLLLLLLLLMLLLLLLHFERLLMHDRMGYEATGGEVDVSAEWQSPLRRPRFSCLEFKTLARLLLLARFAGLIPVDVVEVGRIGETPSLAPAFLWATNWTKWIRWVRPSQSVLAVVCS